MNMLQNVKATCLSESHSFSKRVVDRIVLVAGLGVQHDAHMGKTVKHRSRVAQDPTQPNLRLVHLLHSELLTVLVAAGFNVSAGSMGENILTEGLDLMRLPTDSILSIGADAVVQITGLRNPCFQLNDYQEGLVNAVLDHDEDGGLIRKAGIMGIVLAGEAVKADDEIYTSLPTEPNIPLQRV